MRIIIRATKEEHLEILKKNYPLAEGQLEIAQEHNIFDEEISIEKLDYIKHMLNTVKE